MFPRQQSPLHSVMKDGRSDRHGNRVADADDDMVVLKGRGQLEDVL